jgi:hypothetical protein
MPDNTNPIVVRFCNEKIRAYADAAVTLYETAQALNAYWNAGAISGLIPANNADQIADGAHSGAVAPDGRFPITNSRVLGAITVCGAQLLWFDTSNRINTFRQVSVNGLPKF